MLKNQVYQFIKDGETAVECRAQKEIERNRKGDFCLLLADREGRMPEGTRVEAEMVSIDFNFGANLFMLGEYDDPEKNRRYQEEFCGLFNSAAVPFYWEGTEPEPGRLRYASDSPRDVYRRPPADTVRDFCMEHGLRMKGHPLFWHQFVPQWLPDSFAELKPLIERRFAQIAERYRDTIEAFDVVNEPSRVYRARRVYRYDMSRKCINPDDDYCLWLFDLAKRYFPCNKLILNDTVGAAFIEYSGKYSGYYLNIKDLLNRGARIDEIGMQCHLGGRDPENVYNSEILYDILDTYAAIGKPINISEISIPSRFDEGVDEELQALAAERLYQVCFSHPAVTGITWWNLPDDGVLTRKMTEWGENLPSTGLLDLDYREKLAYKTLQRLIRQEWTTRETVKVENGEARFRGFYGDYRLTVTAEGKRYETMVKLRRDMERVCKIML